jgi:tetratricopeptide (TPR) repeat protein
MRKKLRLLEITCLLLLILPTLACINEYDKTIHGKERKHDEEANEINYRYLRLIQKALTDEEQASEQKYWLQRKQQFEAEITELNNSSEALLVHQNKMFEVKSDYASALLHLGETQKAVEILEALIQKYPKEYNINANLGTAYELAGKPEKALLYLKKAVEINPDSHEGSEWIHVKILEAKIALQKNPNWLKENNLLGLDFGTEGKPTQKESKLVKKLAQQLGYQLSERMYFIKPKDVMVGDLLFILGDVYALEVGLEPAIEIYQLAETYTVSNPDLLAKRLAATQALKEQVMPSFVSLAVFSIVVLVVLGWAFFRFR